MGFFQNALWYSSIKVQGFKRRIENKKASAFTSRQAPQLIKAYDFFGQQSQLGAPRQPFKGWDVWRLLDVMRPGFIFEAGSGTTSAVFALWAKKHGARYLCFENDPVWAGVTENCLRQSNLIGKRSPVRFVEAILDDRGESIGFKDDIPVGADFIYIDGPPCKLDKGKKVPNNDMNRCLENGARPKVVVIDGRVDTVDMVNTHSSRYLYDFFPSFVYCLRRSLWKQSFFAGEHTRFVAKGTK